VGGGEDGVLPAVHHPVAVLQPAVLALDQLEMLVDLAAKRLLEVEASHEMSLLPRVAATGPAGRAYCRSDLGVNGPPA
jgi:hypothetical protein